MNKIFIILLAISLSCLFVYKVLMPRNILTQEEFTAQSSSTILSENTEAAETTTKKILIEAIPDTTFGTFEISNLSKYLYGVYPAPEPIYAVKKYKIKYTSKDENNNDIKIFAQFYIPDVKTEQSFPIYVFGQGTTGIGDMCAASREQPRSDNWGDYQTHMLSYAAQGYIVMFPDYEGFNDPTRIHHYFNAKLEANVLLDGARATYEFLNSDSTQLVKPQDAIFFAGYSQGGHAAFAVSDQAADYAPELPIKGVIGYGPTTDMEALLIENPILAPYVAYSYSDFYGKDKVDPAQILAPNLISSLAANVTSICIGKISQAYSSKPSETVNNAFYKSLTNKTLEQDFPEIKKILDENDTGLVKNDIPGLVLQGATDPIVTVKSQKEFLRKACDAGNSISYKEYAGVHHYQTRQVSMKDTLNWMRQILDGKTPSSYCTNIQ